MELIPYILILLAILCLGVIISYTEINRLDKRIIELEKKVFDLENRNG